MATPPSKRQKSGLGAPKEKQSAERRGQNSAAAQDDDLCELQASPLARTLNVVSSDTIIDKQTSPVIKNRNANADGAVLFSSCSKNDGYKKMNKEPQLEMAHYSGEFVPIAPPI